LAKIVSIHSFRGGTGKSNLTANLAATVAMRGNRVGVIDTDIQSPGIHVLFNLEEGSIRHALNDFLWGRCRIEEAAHDVTAAVANGSGPPAGGGIFLIPSSLNAGEIARVLREGYDVSLLTDGYREIVRALQLDYLFIDTHPGVNEETLLSIAISDKLAVILRPDNQDYQGTAVTVELARRLEVKDMFLMLNKVPDGIDHDALREKVEAAYGAPVAGLFPLTLEIAKLASGGLFCPRYPHHVFNEQLRHVADRIAE
jgi:MinD-like ATPase involved in chromosome partitioning or flagellar assembly